VRNDLYARLLSRDYTRAKQKTLKKYPGGRYIEPNPPFCPSPTPHAQARHSTRARHIARSIDKRGRVWMLDTLTSQL
jgi:hypothetical protein